MKPNTKLVVQMIINKVCYFINYKYLSFKLFHNYHFDLYEKERSTERLKKNIKNAWKANIFEMTIGY